MTETTMPPPEFPPFTRDEEEECRDAVADVLHRDDQLFRPILGQALATIDDLREDLARTMNSAITTASSMLNLDNVRKMLRPQPGDRDYEIAAFLLQSAMASDEIFRASPQGWLYETVLWIREGKVPTGKEPRQAATKAFTEWLEKGNPAKVGPQSEIARVLHSLLEPIGKVAKPGESPLKTLARLFEHLEVLRKSAGAAYHDGGQIRHMGECTFGQMASESGHASETCTCGLLSALGFDS